MRRIASVAMALCFSVAVAHAQQTATSQAPAAKPAAATLTGTWTGSFKDMDPQSGGKDETAMIVLKQDGDVLTGTAGPNASQQWAIAKAKMATTKEGTAVTFEVTSDGGITLQFDLKLVDGHLKGGAKAEHNGEKKSASVDLVRAK